MHVFTSVASREGHHWPITRTVVVLFARGNLKVSLRVDAKTLDSLWPPAIICAPRDSEAKRVGVFALGLFFLNCLEIFDAVVSPKEFSDRR
jgi:hypothetical protein